VNAARDLNQTRRAKRVWPRFTIPPPALLPERSETREPRVGGFASGRGASDSERGARGLSTPATGSCSDTLGSTSSDADGAESMTRPSTVPPVEGIGDHDGERTSNVVTSGDGVSCPGFGVVVSLVRHSCFEPCGPVRGPQVGRPSRPTRVLC
jgi:hypothetical protein